MRFKVGTKDQKLPKRILLEIVHKHALEYLWMVAVLIHAKENMLIPCSVMFVFQEMVKQFILLPYSK